MKPPVDLFEQVRGRQEGRGYRDEITERLGAVWLHTDLGPSFYLTADGRVLADDVTTATPIHEVDAPEIYVALVAGSRTISAPELLTLLPPRCTGARDCDQCGGKRLIELVQDVSAKRGLIICPRCSGLGWQSGELAVDAVVPGLVSSHEPLQRQDWDFVLANGVDGLLQFCRVAMSTPHWRSVAIVVNNSPPIPQELRAVLAIALASKYERAAIAFIDNDEPGRATLSTASEGDSFAVAVATAVYKAACGWDESSQFHIRVDGCPYRIGLRSDGAKWQGTMDRRETAG